VSRSFSGSVDESLFQSDVPAQAKVALAAASGAGPDLRHTLLERAARKLYWLTPLACEEARELVGLPAGSCG
jgi:hypothetical protein